MKLLQGLALGMLILLSAFAASAKDTGEDAFARKDYAMARSIWLEAANAGSAQAKLGIALLADRGLGEPRDPQKAFRWYLDAATDGMTEAQFNVAVMLDAGIGTTQDTPRAMVWYSRAALRGHARAQYNLGLLYATGEGTARNTGLATYWFAQAATAIPAAIDQLDALAPDTVAAPTGPPTVIYSELDPPRAEFVWTAQQGPKLARFRVEIVAVPKAEENYGEPVLNTVTYSSGLLSEYMAPIGDLLWRVSALTEDDTGYSTTGWQGPERIPAPKGRVNFFLNEADGGMRELAALLAADLRRSGYWVRITLRKRGAAAGSNVTTVGYSYVQDEALAGTIAAFIPVLSADDTVLALPGATLPGEIYVRLNGASGDDGG